jgi:hypothetical protein
MGQRVRWIALGAFMTLMVLPLPRADVPVYWRFLEEASLLTCSFLAGATFGTVAIRLLRGDERELEQVELDRNATARPPGRTKSHLVHCVANLIVAVDATASGRLVSIGRSR